MKWERESTRAKEQESYQHTQVRLSPDQAKRILRVMKKEINLENFNKCAELDWPSIFDLS